MQDHLKKRSRMKQKPLRHVRRYEETLGVSAEAAYSLTDYIKKLNWGKNRSFMRRKHDSAKLATGQADCVKKTENRLKKLGPLCVNLVLVEGCECCLPLLPKESKSSSPALAQWCQACAELGG